MKHEWALYKGATLMDVGYAPGETERDAMRSVLASRSWRGDRWKLRVGSLSTTFDEEDVALLTGMIGDEHEIDNVGRERRVKSDYATGGVVVGQHWLLVFTQDTSGMYVWYANVPCGHCNQIAQCSITTASITGGYEIHFTCPLCKSTNIFHCLNYARSTATGFEVEGVWL